MLECQRESLWCRTGRLNTRQGVIEASFAAILPPHERRETMSKENTEEKISAVARAVNKVRAIQKGIVEVDIAVGGMALKLGDALEALPTEKRDALEAALSKRNRGAEFQEGDSVVVKAEFSDLYKPKGPYTVTAVMTVGGDEKTKRGGRAYLKAKHSNGNTIAAPVSCFEAA